MMKPSSGLLRSPRSLACLLGALVLVPLAARGQDLGTDCELVDYRTTNSQVFGADRITWIGGPNMVCPDGVRIRADSAVVYEANGRSELIGNVEMDHPERTLRAAFADLYEQQDELFARGNVDFRDLVRGSEIRGDTLRFLEGGRVRPEDEMSVVGFPAVAVLVPGADDLSDVPRTPYTVRATRIRSQGEQYFWASGDADIEREDLQATSDSLFYEEQQGNLILTGNARTHRDGLELEGERITLLLPNDELRSVELLGRGRLFTDDLELLGDEVRITLQDEQIQRLVAVLRPVVEGIESAGPPRLITEDVYMRGDSIDVDAPGEVLRTVSAAGSARVETRRASTPQEDLVEEDVPALDPTELSEADQVLAGLSVDDWLEGDLIITSFLPVESSEDLLSPDDAEPEAPEAEAAPQYRIDEIVASGNARSWYRAPPDGDGPAPGDRRLWAISYVLADDIVIHMVEGEVEWIEAIGSVRGMQLEPDRPAEPAAVTEDFE
jgi:lipopolysaccharide export system protein LptA